MRGAASQQREVLLLEVVDLPVELVHPQGHAQLVDGAEQGGEDEPADEETIQENPFLPSFVMHEINNRPERLKEFMLKGGVQPNYIIKTIEDAKKQGLIHPLTGGELMMSMIGLCVIPVIGRPIFKTFFYNNSDEEYDDFLKNREKRVIQFIFNAIYINPPKA